MIKRFTYTKPNGAVSERLVYVLNMPSQMLFGIDLTEFDEKDRKNYIAALKTLHEDYLTAIQELGLHHNYRNFKEEGIYYEDSST